MKKIIAVILVSAALLSLFACGNKNDGDSTATGAVEGSADKRITLVSGEITDYVIVYNPTEQDGYTNAYSMRALIEKISGVKLDIKMCSNNYSKEIAIGNCERDINKRLMSELSDNDFAISVDSERISVCATDKMSFKRALITFRDAWITSGDNGDIEVRVLGDYLYSRDGEMDGVGRTLNIVENGKSEYTIVCTYDDPSSVCIARYIQQLIKEKYGVSIPVKDGKDTNGAEIIIGSAVDRQSAKEANELMQDGVDDDFIFFVDGEDVVISAKNAKGLLMGALWFEDRFIYSAEQTDLLAVNEMQLYAYGACGQAYKLREGVDFVSVYKNTYNTFGSDFELLLYSATSQTLPAADKKDQLLVEALKDRLGSSVVFYVGDAKAVYKKYFVRLNTEDYAQSAKLSGGKLYIPRQFASNVFGIQSSDADGFANITDFCSASSEWTLYRYSGTPLYIAVNKDTSAFNSLSDEIDGYSNRQYLERLVEFYTSNAPEVDCDSEQTRRVVTYYEYPTDVLNWLEYEYVTAYSPAITLVDENGKSVIYVSNEYAKKYGGEEVGTKTVLKKSTDGGVTWTEVGSVNELRWASLFSVEGEIYLMGNDRGLGTAVIAHLKSDGSFETATVSLNVGGGAPNSVLVYNGRIYKAYNGNIVSAKLSDDIMKPSSWTVSQALSSIINVKWLCSVTGDSSHKNVHIEEGNVVLGPDGKIYAIYRLNSAGINHAVIVEVSADGKTVSIVEECQSFLTLPTTQSKFSVRYDEVSGRYFAITSTYYAGSVNARTVLTLIYSTNLIDWEVAGNLLVERELMNAYCSSYAHGFQYVDFVIDGNDILYVVREAYGYANDWHDGNYVTLYTVENFRDMLN